MRQPTEYLKMRVLGAIDMAEGKTQRDRMRVVSAMPFTDEDGNARHFTWRTIETWLVRYNKHGVTALSNQPRKDIGRLRKVNREEVQEAIDQVLPRFHTATPKRVALYRACIEAGLLQRERIAPNTFSRVVKTDNTFSFKNMRLEAPRHLPNRTIQVRFERKRPQRKIVVYYKGERMGEARQVDFTANDRPPAAPKTN